MEIVRNLTMGQNKRKAKKGSTQDKEFSAGN